MGNLLSRAAGGAVDAVLFGVGFLTGTVHAVVNRARGEKADDETPDLWVPRPRDEYVEAPPAAEPPHPEDVDVTTPVGTTGAGVGFNPSTAEADLQQPGTEQIMEPSTTKRVKSETETLRKAAERNPD